MAGVDNNSSKGAPVAPTVKTAGNTSSPIQGAAGAGGTLVVKAVQAPGVNAAGQPVETAQPVLESLPPAIANPMGTFSGGAPVAPGNPLAPAAQPLAANRRSFKLWGDPHVVAGDGKKFDNEQVGTITQMRSASGDFELQTTQQHPPGKPNVTVNTSAAIKSGNDLISYDVTRHQLVANHKPLDLAKGQSYALPGGTTITRDDKGNYSLVTAKNDKINLSVAHTKKGAAYLNIDGQLGAGRTSGEVTGAMGAFHNGDAANADFVGADGKTYDAKYGHGDHKSLVSKNTYDQAAVDGFEKSWLVNDPSKSLLEQSQGQGTSDAKWQADAQQFSQSEAKHSKSSVGLPAPNRKSSGPLTGSNTKDGNTLPSAGGRATTFWNGAYAYKGQHDTENMSGGAWGDPNKPTEYICALPVGLQGGGDWWHNQKILVTNPSTGKQVVVKVQDKGPAPSTGNAIDLSPVAKEALGVSFMDNLDVHIAFAPDNAPVGPVA